jgi:hypothetical protein
MVELARDTTRRPDELRHPADPRNPDPELYARSYLLIRMVVGIIGVLLPLALIVGEAYFLRGDVHVRGSLSAYYHTSMRDLFVASLCVTGFLLATYMSGKSNPEFWSSFVAGVAVIGVVFFPTQRPHLLEDAPRCGSTPMPEGCSPIQQRFGENAVAVIHFTCAAVFIMSLAWICLYIFAYREKKYKENGAMAAIMYTCGWTIVAAVAWAILGGLLKVTIWELTPLYIAEVISVWAFGVAWLLKSRDLWGALGHAVTSGLTDQIHEEAQLRNAGQAVCDEMSSVAAEDRPRKEMK